MPSRGTRTRRGGKSRRGQFRRALEGQTTTLMENAPQPSSDGGCHSREPLRVPSLFLLSFLAELQGPLLRLSERLPTSSTECLLPQQLDDIEQQLAKASDGALSATMQTITQESVTFREPSRTRLGSLVPSWLRLLPAQGVQESHCGRPCSRSSRGSAISIRVVYYSRKCDRGQHREHKGCATALECLGIFDRLGPTLASHAALTAACPVVSTRPDRCCAYKALL